MSETSSEGRGGRFSRWRSRSRGTNTMKAGYALAQHNARNMNRETLEGISRAGMTPVDLQRLAQAAVNAEARGGAFIGQSQRLGQVATDRMQANRAPQGRTVNPIRRAARGISRWRHQRNGAKIVKAGMVMAAKQAKNADRGVRQAMDPRGDGKLTPAQMASLVEGRMDQVFRPSMQGQQQQAQQGPGQQAQGQVQGQVQGQGQQVPQQGPQTQQAPSLVDQLQVGQQRQVELMAEMQQLQVEMQQLIQTRMEQINQEVANLAAIQSQMAQFNQQLAQPQAQVQQDPNAQFPVGQHAIIQTDEPAQTGEPAVTGEAAQTGEPAVAGEPTAETVQLPAEGDPQQAPAPASPQAVEGDGPQLGGGDAGQQVAGGEPPVVAAPQEAEGADPQLGEGAPAPVAEGGPQQVEGGEPQLGDGADGAQPQVAASGAQQAVQGGPANGQQVEGGDRQAAGQQLSRAQQWMQVVEPDAAHEGQDDPKGVAAKLKAETATAQHAGLNPTPPRGSTAAEAAKTAEASARGTTGAQRAGSAASKNTQQTGPRST